MGIFDGLKKAFSKENVKDFFEFAEGLIVILVKDQDLTGEQKKAKVDVACENYLREKLSQYGAIVRWACTRFLFPALPTITQSIYDFLKKFVDNLTRQDKAE